MFLQKKNILRVYCFVYHEQGVLMVGFIKFIVYCYFPPGDWDYNVASCIAKIWN